MDRLLREPSPKKPKNRLEWQKAKLALHQRFMRKDSPKDRSFRPGGKQRIGEGFGHFARIGKDSREKVCSANRCPSTGFEATKKPVKRPAEILLVAGV